MKDDNATFSPADMKTGAAVANERRARVLVSLALIFLPLVYFFPAVIGEVTLAPGDGWTQILGIRILIGNMITQGQLPLWNPYIFGGMPLLASIQPGALYPATWLFAVLSPQAAMNVMVITTYHIALIGTYLYGRRVGMSRVGAVLAGVTFSFGGYMVAHLGHSNRIAAAAWLPWILLALEELHLRLRWRWVALGSVFIALQLFAGEPQMNCYTILVAGAYGLFSLRWRRDGESARRFLFGAAAMGLCGALIAMIQLLPAREMLKFGERAGIDYEYFGQFSFPPRQVFSLLAPYFFGGAALEPYRVYYWGEWNLTETCGYAGLIALLLALIAVISQFSTKSRNRLILFWVGCAAIALFLSFGVYMPFKIHRLLYHVPVYKLFRASGRHLFEFTFAIGILAGFGATVLPKMDRAAARRVMLAGIGLMTLVVGTAVIVYRFFDARLVTKLPLPAAAGSLTNPDIYIPVTFFIFGVVALLIYFRRWSRLSGVVIVAMLFLELMAFGFSYEWRLIERNLRATLADSPSVKFIKEREPDLNAFRIVSHTSADPFKVNTDLLDFPNISIARGLQSVNGYDPVRLWRTAEMTGNMTLDGYITESNTFASGHRGLNLLNAKYLLSDTPGESGSRVAFDGVEFADPPMTLLLAPSVKTRIDIQAQATELVIISAMGNAIAVPNGKPVVKLKLHTAGGGVIEKEVLAGRDTSEWAYDRENVKAVIKHNRAPVVETWDVVGFQGHRFIARLPFDRSEIKSIELEYLLNEADITISRASLYDAETKSSYPLNNLNLPAERWRQVASFDSIRLYENLKARPRAWFVPATAVLPSAEVLQAIKTGRMPDGAQFNPEETVLLESEIFSARPLQVSPSDPTTPGASKGEARITRYEPQRIELQTRNDRSEFLILSEIYYRGWECWIDGKRTPVERVNYTLRGVIVPAGEHRIEFVFRAPSFRNGASWSLLGILLLLLGFAGISRRTMTRIETRLQGSSSRAGGALRSGAGKAITRVLIALRTGVVALCRPKVVLSAVVIGLILYGAVLVKYASYAAGGSDSSGYVRIARSILKGNIVQRVTELDRLGLSDEFAGNFLTLAYTPGPKPGTISPCYPIGLPMMMAVGALISGWEYGPYLVSPLAAALSLLLIYLIGQELGLPRGFSIAGAAILAACPPFIFIGLQPMSDVLATFWALLTVLAALRSRKRDGWALLAGAAFGMAFLTRPTNILLLFPLVFSLRIKPKPILYFVLAGLPLAAIFLMYNTIAYAHPLQTGFSQFDLMKVSGFKDRFYFYCYWLARIMGPLLLIGWLGVALARKSHWRDRAMLVVWFGAFFLFYTFYDIYGDWWYTRFILPGVPAMILGALLIVRDLPALLGRFEASASRYRLQWIALAILLAVTLGKEWRILTGFDVFRVGAGEALYLTSCRWADQALPNNSLVVAMQMSGSLKIYTERPVVYWADINPTQLPTLKKHAAERGYRWYALLLPFEVEIAQSRLGGKWVQIGKMDMASLWQIEPSSN